MTSLKKLALVASTALAASLPAVAQTQPHNVILFVPDGLRSTIVNHTTAPTFTYVKKKGVWFKNSHSIFPTFTTLNASSMATGHYPGDHGDFSNTIYVGFPEQQALGSITPFLESDTVLADIDDNFLGTVLDQGATVPVGYLDEETILASARAAGFQTAAVGKVGPVAIFDHENSALVNANLQDTRGNPTIFVDDRTGSTAGIPLSQQFIAALQAAGLPTVAPGRGANGNSGNNTTPGTTVPNNIQQDYFTDVVTNVVLPQFKSTGQPFVLVFWSRDPDGTQHNQGDSLNTLTPGINGPTSLAAIANADSDLARIMDALDRTGLAASTDVIVSADHGFNTISKNSGPGNTQSQTSYAATQTYYAYRNGALAQEVNTGFLPPGFLAIDLANALGEPLVDPDSLLPGSQPPYNQTQYVPVDPTQPPAQDGSRRQRPASGDGDIGADPTNPDVVVAANGGSDLVYLPNANTRGQLVTQIVNLLLSEDYVSGVFVDDSLGSIPGTLPLSAINLKGRAITPVPTIVVNFKSFSTAGQGCTFSTDVLCGVVIADSTLQQGQGMHGSFDRADTNNFMAAIGPDFQSGFTDPAPVSNADIGQTIAHILGLNLPRNGTLVGRVATEAFPNGAVPQFYKLRQKSDPAANGQVTILDTQVVNNVTRYFDAAGFPGATVGLK